MPEDWRPVRFVAVDQTCHLCWYRIPRGSPGTTTGSRGTRAFFLPAATLQDGITGAHLLGPGLWECVACRLAA